MNFVPFFQQKLCQVRTILSSDSSNQCFPHKYLHYLATAVAFILFINHLYVLAIPSSRRVFACHPSSFNLVTSTNFLGVPSGFDRLKTISPLKPTTSLIFSAKS